MNLAFILKALGIKLTPEQIAGIETIIPQIPAKIQQTILVINAGLENFDRRLRAIETTQAMILAKLQSIQEDINGSGDNGNGDIRPAGIGATERAIRDNRIE